MKIYLVINETTKTQALTASDYIAKMHCETKVAKGEKIHLYEADLKTQGKSFNSWANNWKELEIKKPF